MSDGVFRDASGALERAAVLEEENQALHEELVGARRELDELRRLLDDARGGAPFDTRAELDRVRGQREELHGRVERGIVERAALREARDALTEELRQRNERLYDAQLELVKARERISKLEHAVERAREDNTLPVIPENASAYARRVQDERDELQKELKELRAAQAQQGKPRSLLARLFGPR